VGGRDLALSRRGQPLEATLEPLERHHLALVPRREVGALGCGVDLGAGGMIAVGDRLVAVRSLLLVVRGALVAGRRGLVGVRGGWSASAAD
jgi:hypothetical protein